MRRSIFFLLALNFLFLSNAFILQGCVPDDYAAITSGNELRVYRLAPGDHIRLVVFDQPSLSNTYSIDPSGNISVPLAGTIKAEGKTTQQLEVAIIGRLKDENLVSEAKAAVEVVTFRPFSILGEVKTPGRFPYAPGMTIESAVALAGGYTLHSDKERIRVTRKGTRGETVTEYWAPTATVMPGDTIFVRERWF
jgi:polysaccharide biosynthesis/export protein